MYVYSGEGGGGCVVMSNELSLEIKSVPITLTRKSRGYPGPRLEFTET